MAKRKTAIAIFEDRTRAQRAIEELRRAGFTEKEIGITARDTTGTGADDGHKETHATEGAIAGVTAGAGVGALWGLGILAGVLPAIGPAIAGGTLAAILSSAAAGAATAGIAGALIGLGIPEDEARYYDEEFRAGRILVTVDARGRLDEAQAILSRNGGYDQRSAPQATRRTDDGMRAGDGGRMRPGDGAGMRDRRTLEAREEELRVSKRPVQTGEAEIRKEVRTERQTVDVPVRKEELVVERHATGRQPASGPVGDGESVRIPLSEEQVEIEKEPVVRERLSVGKRTTEEEEHIAANVRKEDFKVDKRGRVTPNPR
jgi:uncharacterized protein (TIGR02271 family)